MIWFAAIVIVAPAAFFAYAYVGYPVILRVLAARRPAPAAPSVPTDGEWPYISITVPAYNEERSIRRTLEELLRVDYPADRRQILVISDGSTDRTDDIVREFHARGVELLRIPQRAGKTAAENAAGRTVRYDLIVNTDASVRIPPTSLKPLVRAFADPTVGVASGRDVSVGDEAREANRAESGYVGYEMRIRDLETRVGSIVGASGCFFGFRRAVNDTDFPEGLSRDFASALLARERGYRAVSVDDALVIVPRTTSLQAEYRRKIRTMARGIQTLWYKRHLMNPFRYGVFAFMLVSHKLCRWLVYLAIPPAALAIAVLATRWTPALFLLAAGVAAWGAGIVALRWPEERRMPRLLALVGFAAVSALAGVMAWVRVFRRQRDVKWEPTRRPGAAAA
ncbi:MAG TPA: glycosyltransferase [Gemmatimonadaceae bacterium]|nr:glycosyltransferase [Gemmatimonadaceae bacterium]